MTTLLCSTITEEPLLQCPSCAPNTHHLHTRSADPLITMPYADVEAIDIGGPGQVKRWSAGQQVGLALAFGLPGAGAGIGSTKIQTIVRMRAADSEIFFLDTQQLADALRIELAMPLKAIHDAHPRHDANDGNPEQKPRNPSPTSSPGSPTCSTKACLPATSSSTSKPRSSRRPRKSEVAYNHRSR